MSSISAAIFSDITIVLFMIFYGPIPGLNFELDWIFISTFLCIGVLGVGFGVVSSYARILEASLKLGYNQDVNLNLLLSSLWTSTLFLSNFLGMTVSGILIGYFGLRNATIILLSMNVSALLIDIFCCLLEKRVRQSNEYMVLK